MAMVLMALAGWLVVRVVHALADAGNGDQAADSLPAPAETSRDGMVGLAGFEPTTP